MHGVSARRGSAAPIPCIGEEEAQVEEAGATSQLVFHGREMPWLLQDHDSVQSRTEGGRVRRMFHDPLPANWRSC